MPLCNFLGRIATFAIQVKESSMVSDNIGLMTDTYNCYIELT